MANEIETRVSEIMEELRRRGIPDERGRLRIPQEDEQAIFTLLAFFRDKFTVFALGHEIHVKRSQHVV